MFRILLADDQPLIHSGVRALLEAEDNIEVVGEAADGRQAVALAVEHSRARHQRLHRRGLYNTFPQPVEPRAWLKRQYGMGVQYLVMTTPARHKERSR